MPAGSTIWKTLELVLHCMIIYCCLLLHLRSEGRILYLSVCLEFFSRTASRNFLIFCMKLVWYLTQKVTESDLWEKNILFWGFRDKRAQNGHQMRFFKWGLPSLWNFSDFQHEVKTFPVFVNLFIVLLSLEWLKKCMIEDVKYRFKTAVKKQLFSAFDTFVWIPVVFWWFQGE